MENTKDVNFPSRAMHLTPNMAKNKNKVVTKEKDLTKDRLVKLAPLAQQIIEMITEAKLPIGDVHAHDNAKFDHVAGKVLQIFLENEIKYSDKEFMFQLVLQPFDVIRETVVLSLKKSMDIVMERLLTKDFRDVTTKDMDDVMRRPKPRDPMAS